MCGRYSQTVPFERLRHRFNLDLAGFDLRPRYNIAPGQVAPIAVAAKSSFRALKALRWGLIPSWAKDSSFGEGLINARAETLLEKPSFKSAFRKQRCLVLADGFYEWRSVPGTSRKTPIRFVLKTREPFSMAGIWEAWEGPIGVIESFAIITTLADDFMRPFHDRMPVIFRPEEEDRWLDPAQKDPAKLASFLAAPSPSHLLEAYEVSTLVNSPSNDSPDCFKPVALN